MTPQLSTRITRQAHELGFLILTEDEHTDVMRYCLDNRGTTIQVGPDLELCLLARIGVQVMPPLDTAPAR